MIWWIGDLARHRDIKFSIIDSAELKFRMNKDLAGILLANLIKNAIIHGEKKSKVGIKISATTLIISNTAQNGALNPHKVFSRFQEGSTSKSSTGIGLAIAQTIAKKYALHLEYNYNGKHNFQLRFPV